MQFTWAKTPGYFTWAKTPESPDFTRYSAVYLGKDPKVLYLGKDPREPRLHKVQCSLPGQRSQGAQASLGTLQFTWAKTPGYFTKTPGSPGCTRYSVVYLGKDTRVLYLGKDPREPRLHKVQCSLPGQRPQGTLPGQRPQGAQASQGTVLFTCVVYLGKDPGVLYWAKIPGSPGCTRYSVVYLGRDPSEPGLHKVQCSLPEQKTQGARASQDTLPG